MEQRYLILPDYKIDKIMNLFYFVEHFNNFIRAGQFNLEVSQFFCQDGSLARSIRFMFYKHKTDNIFICIKIGLKLLALKT